ncbi:hypothetical protein C5B76_22355 [Aeromonas salmonicida]|nr:hypothetical protein C5B76_22355 [Aeromonas salmonicida]
MADRGNELLEGGVMGGDYACQREEKTGRKRMSASLLSQQALLSFAALQDRRALLQATSI